MKRLFCALLALLLISITLPTAAAAPQKMKLSDDGLAFLKRMEGFAEKPYLDNGVWRVGYNTAVKSGEYKNGISKAEASELLRRNVVEYEDKVNGYLAEHGLKLKQSRFDALVSFTYNAGIGWSDPTCRFSSILLSGLTTHDELDVFDAFVVWCHVGKTVDAKLAQRRIAECCLLLYGDYSGDKAKSFTYAVLSGNGGSAPSDIVCFRVGGRLSERLPQATRRGYDFAGWYTTANKPVRAGDTIGEPVKLVAKWFSNAALPFGDVPGDAWYRGYVSQLCATGVIDGMTPSTFVPAGKVTYGQALKLVLIATGLEPYDREDDSGAHWAQRYLDMALDEQIIDERFCPGLDAPITRLELARLASAAMGMKKKDGKTPFADADDASILALWRAGVVEGTTGSDGMTYYYPQNEITRAEISAIVWRILSYQELLDQSGSITYGSHTVSILSSVRRNRKEAENFYTENGFRRYEGKTTYTGVDVSHHQGEIDWKKVKRAGIDFAMIRVGGRGYGAEGVMYDDRTFEQNIKGALAAGLKVGVYYFSQAVSVEEAREEARYVLQKIKNYDVSYPVVFDWEYLGGRKHRTYTTSTDTICKAAVAFCDMVQEAGYTPMIYFNTYCGYLKYDLSRVNQYDFWYAQYSEVPTFYYDFQMWQYTDKGRIPGIEGKVDLDISFIDYAAK